MEQPPERVKSDSMELDVIKAPLVTHFYRIFDFQQMINASPIRRAMRLH
jgi:hypothetical protein